MPYAQFKSDQLRTVTTNLTTGQVTYGQPDYWGTTVTNSRSNSVRRLKPVDLFGSGTAYQAYSWKCSDYGYVRPPGVNPGLRVLQSCQYDSWVGPNWIFNIPGVAQIESRLRAKIKDQNVNLAQSVAEYRQASKMFSGLAQDIFQTFRSLRSGRGFAELVRILQRPKGSQELALANRWLQYQYGLKPLMSDLYGTSEALAKGIRDGMFLYVRSTLKDKLFLKRISSDQNTDIVSSDIVIRGIARYKISDPTMKMVSQFGITNPLLLAWELIPYSFVIDWMFPVGNFLSSLDALNGTSDLRVITSTTEVQEGQCVPKYGGQGSFFKGIRYNRNGPKSSLSLPKLSYKPSSSLTAVLNGLALLTQLRHR